MGELRMIECADHGPRPETFVCQHLALSLRTRKPVGFFWAQGAKERPDAWCQECNQRVKAAGGRWVGEAAEKLGVRLICAGCYDDLHELNLPKKPQGAPSLPKG